MSDTKTSEGAKAWLLEHERSAKKVTRWLIVGGAVVVVAGLFIQVWIDLGWVPLSELDSIAWGDEPAIPKVGDFWGMMAIGVVLVPAILGGAGRSEAKKRSRARIALTPALNDAARMDAKVVACTWSSADVAALVTVEDEQGVSHELRDSNPLGQWQVSAGTAVGLWVTPDGRRVVGTGKGLVSGEGRPGR